MALANLDFEMSEPFLSTDYDAVATCSAGSSFGVLVRSRQNLAPIPTQRGARMMSASGKRDDCLCPKLGCNAAIQGKAECYWLAPSVWRERGVATASSAPVD